MRLKILYSKKGISTDEAVPFVIFIIVAVFGIFLFNINERVKGNQLVNDIQIQKDISGGHNLLINYLKQTDDQGNKQDFIAKSVINKNYVSLKTDLDSYFSKNLINPNWYLEIKDSSKKIVFKLDKIAFSADDPSLGHKTYSVGFVVVPINNQDQDYISIELFFAR